MAKTFDNSLEASEINYCFIITQKTVVLRHFLPIPPPLNVLGLPCNAICLLWAKGQEQKAAADQAHSSAMEDGRGEDKEMKTFAQKIVPLAEKITEYILDHQDDTTRESSWQNIMRRETMKRFREQREASDTQHKAIAEVLDKQSKEIDKQREAITKVHQLVMKLANVVPDAD